MTFGDQYRQWRAMLDPESNQNRASLRESIRHARKRQRGAA